MAYQPLTELDFTRAFPASRKVHVEGGQGVRVPMREIALSQGEAPVLVYDTSGPHFADARTGLPALRDGWIRARGDVDELRRSSNRVVLRAGPGRSVTQLHYA